MHTPSPSHTYKHLQTLVQQEESVTLSMILQSQLGDPQPRHMSSGLPTISVQQPLPTVPAGLSMGGAEPVVRNGCIASPGRPLACPDPGQAAGSVMSSNEAEIGLLEEVKLARSEVSTLAVSRSISLLLIGTVICPNSVTHRAGT
jgi:hypothetical protein